MGGGGVGGGGGVAASLFAFLQCKGVVVLWCWSVVGSDGGRAFHGCKSKVRFVDGGMMVLLDDYFNFHSERTCGDRYNLHYHQYESSCLCGPSCDALYKSTDSLQVK